MDTLGKLNPDFVPVELTKPDQEPRLKYILLVLRLQIIQEFQAAHKKNSQRVKRFLLSIR